MRKQARGIAVPVQLDAGDTQEERFVAAAQPPPKKKKLRGLAPSGMKSFGGGFVPLYSSQFGTAPFVEVAMGTGNALKSKLPQKTYINIEALMSEYKVPDAPVYMFNDGIRPSMRPLNSVP